ncbi:DUF1592 domain-containing protein [Roseisolibacter sp. H3M3-2]|nr:DUF1592 domain-containing protein [Roseisolibacter sp. H3M3-2]
MAVATLTAVVSFKVGLEANDGLPRALASNPAVRGAHASRPASDAAKAPRRARRKPAANADRDIATLNDVVDAYCIDCHSAGMLMGNLDIEGFDIATADTMRHKAEKMIRKLRTEMMPLPGRPRPGGDTLRLVAEAIERRLDRGGRVNPGANTFQRLNRAEYERAIRDLLGIKVNAGDYLPLDTKSANFDNVAAAQMLSPTLLESYLNAATAVSKLAVGDSAAPATLSTYRVSPYASQHPWDRVEGAPYGTRGGIVAEHVFPADGLYEIRFNVGGGMMMHLEDIDVSIDGQQVARLKYEPGVNKSIAMQTVPLGIDLYKTALLPVKAGPHKISVAFVRRAEGPYEDLIKPPDWSQVSNGSATEGTTMPPHIFDMGVLGPEKSAGVSETPSRKLVFSCRPSATLPARACATQIIDKLGTRAYRRPLSASDRAGLLSFYDKGAKKGGFEEGVKVALQAMLASPRFIFRFEQTPRTVALGHDYRITDYELASRLSFFLWGTIPDDRLLRLAANKTLSQPAVMSAEVKRMLADSRSEALASRFAAQWLRLQDVDKVRPDVYWYPDFDDQLAQAMKRETELLFTDIVQRDRPVLELLTADYTFVNEKLARHYGIPDVSGDHFRKVSYPDSTRRGIFGHGSVLLQTSVATRTSPVLRGKWVMEVVLAVPPPPPPPNIPSLEETKAGIGGKQLTTRERMEEHRKNPTCNTCHQYIDPLGLALDNYDVTGRWRYRENAMPLDTRGELYDGTPVTSPAQLSRALLKRPIPIARAFTENLLTYALGRRVEDPDQTTVRQITRSAAANGYRFSSFVTGVVTSPAFRMRRAEAAPAAAVADDDSR